MISNGVGATTREVPEAANPALRQVIGGGTPWDIEAYVADSEGISLITTLAHTSTPSPTLETL